MLLKRLIQQRPHLYDDYPLRLKKNPNYSWILIPLMLIPLGGLIILSVIVSNQDLASRPLISPEGKSSNQFTPGVGGGP